MTGTLTAMARLIEHRDWVPQRTARRGLIILLGLLGLLALILVDQTVHWILERLALNWQPPEHSSFPPLHSLLFGLFYAATACFGYAIIGPGSQRIGILAQFLLLLSLWLIAAASLGLVSWSLPQMTAGINPFRDLAEPTLLEAWLFVLDQTLKGFLFDTLEVFEVSLSPLEPEPDLWWFAATLVIFRSMTSVLSVVVIVRALGLSNGIGSPYMKKGDET